jgi:hypothetical protein
MGPDCRTQYALLFLSMNQAYNRSVHWPSRTQDASARTILWYRWRMVFRNTGIWKGEDPFALLTSMFHPCPAAICKHLQCCLRYYSVRA